MLHHIMDVDLLLFSLTMKISVKNKKIGIREKFDMDILKCTID